MGYKGRLIRHSWGRARVENAAIAKSSKLTAESPTDSPVKRLLIMTSIIKFKRGFQSMFKRG
jgi:hypothetical protein